MNRKVVEYLANYANRVALSDARILDIEGEQVLFSYKDYRDGDQQKRVWIEGVKLIHNFLQHQLPRGMQHIRRYGWMARRAHNDKLEFLREYFSPHDEQACPAEPAPMPLEEEDAKKPCRFCDGPMYEIKSAVASHRPRTPGNAARRVSPRAGGSPRHTGRATSRDPGTATGRPRQAPAGHRDPTTNQRPGGLGILVTRSVRRSEVHGTRNNGDQIKAASPPQRSLPAPSACRTPRDDTSMSPPSAQLTSLHTTSVTVLARASTHLPRHWLTPPWHSPARRYKFII